MKKENLIEGMTLEFVIRLLLVTELDKQKKNMRSLSKELRMESRQAQRRADAKKGNQIK